MNTPFHYEPVPQEIKEDWEAMKSKEQEIRAELQRIMSDRFSACGYTENKNDED